MPNQESKKSYEFFAPKVFIRTFGCQMNVRDSEVICGLLTTNDYQLTTNPNEADVIIFNTCSVRQHAEDKVWSEIGRFKRGAPEHQSTRAPVIGVVGCMAQNYKDEIFRRAPNVDFAVGPSDIHKIPEIIKKLYNARPTTHDPRLLERKIWETDGSVRPEEIYHTGFYEDKEHAYVVISEGCSNFCSYCVVPYVRGPLRNRDYDDILREIKEAVDKGITKITLLGQNVNAYVSSAKRTAHPSMEFTPSAVKGLRASSAQREIQSIPFIKLLRMTNEINGLKEFSFITSHPKDTTQDLFEAMQECGKLKKYLHLPVQSGSDRILKLMNRGYTKENYLDLVNKYRKIVKNGVLTTDIIVGFPTETAGDFLQTQDLVKSVEFDAAYIFKYSVRPHTEAEKLTDDLPKQEKERRHKIILDLQKEISNKKKCV